MPLNAAIVFAASNIAPIFFLMACIMTANGFFSMERILGRKRGCSANIRCVCVCESRIIYPLLELFNVITRSAYCDLKRRAHWQWRGTFSCHRSDPLSLALSVTLCVYVCVA